MVDIVEVEIIRLQAAQAVFDGIDDMHARHARIVGALAGGIEKLSGDDGVAASVFERLAQEGFGFAVAVGVGRVKKINTGVEGEVDDFFDSVSSVP